MPIVAQFRSEHLYYDASNRLVTSSLHRRVVCLCCAGFKSASALLGHLPPLLDYTHKCVSSKGPSGFETAPLNHQESFSRCGLLHRRRTRSSLQRAPITLRHCCFSFDASIKHTAVLSMVASALMLRSSFVNPTSTTLARARTPNTSGGLPSVPSKTESLCIRKGCKDPQYPPPTMVYDIRV